jgi:hypothetical protein
MGRFNLVDSSSGDLVGHYTSQQAAFAIVRSLIRMRGENAAGDLRLEYEDDDGHTWLLDAGDGLVKHAQ